MLGKLWDGNFRAREVVSIKLSELRVGIRTVRVEQVQEMIEVKGR